MAIHGVRWLEASWRNRESKLLVNALGRCHVTYPCEAVCIEIRPRGWQNCPPPKQYDPCSCCETVPTCPEKYMKVCADHIDGCGLHVFVWPKDVIYAKQGMYEAAVIVNGCDEIAKLPLRIGPHPGAHYAEGPLHTPMSDCVTCDDAFDPCKDGINSGCTSCGNNDTAGYAPIVR